MNLREIHLNGGKYTWSNKQSHPTLEKLDRVLMSYEWEDPFPLVSVHKFVRDNSDHNPLLLSSNASKPWPPKKREFCFELSWLKKEEFLPLSKGIWEKLVRSEDPLDILNIKRKRIKKFFKGWGLNAFAHAKKETGNQTRIGGD